MPGTQQGALRRERSDHRRRPRLTDCAIGFCSWLEMWQANECGERRMLVTDLRVLAKMFGLAHEKVLRAYDDLNCSDEIKRLSFEPRDCIEERGKAQLSMPYPCSHYASFAPIARVPLPPQLRIYLDARHSARSHRQRRL